MKTDLTLERQKLLVPLNSHPGAFALVPPLTPTHLKLPRLRGEIAKAEAALEHLQVAENVSRNSLISEAVCSGQIEGIEVNLDEVLTYEDAGSDEGLSDITVTLNYVRALEYGLEKVTRNGILALTIELIQALHARLMAGVGDTPGQLRTEQNWIGGLRIYDAKFVPPPPSRVQECLEDLVRVLQYVPAEESFFETPLVRGNGPNG